MLELDSLPSFPLPTLEEWRSKVQKELKLADWDNFYWHCPEDVALRPLYPPPSQKAPPPASYSALSLPASSKTIPWERLSPLRGDLWKRQLEEALSVGIKHFWLPKEPSYEPDEVLHFFAQEGGDDLHLSTEDPKWISAGNTRGNLPIILALSPGNTQIPAPSNGQDWDFRVLYEQGGNLAHQIAAILAAITQCYAETGQEGLKRQLREHRIHLTTGTGFYREIAKFRVLPLLIQRVLEELEMPKGLKPKIIAHTAKRDLGYKDPSMNALRNSFGALAALIGGCEGICIHPQDTQADLFHLRLSRNIHFLLDKEGKIHKVQDPLAGAYFLEELGLAIGEKAWSHFLEIEAAGGLQEAWEKGVISTWMEEGQAKEAEAVKQGKQFKIGE